MRFPTGISAEAISPVAPFNRTGSLLRVLHIAVLEGKLQQIRLEGVPSRTLLMTFPGMEGKILNLRDIEQGMEQLNRVRQTPVEIEILPGSQQGSQ